MIKGLIKSKKLGHTLDLKLTNEFFEYFHIVKKEGKSKEEIKKGEGIENKEGIDNKKDKNKEEGRN